VARLDGLFSEIDESEAALERARPVNQKICTSHWD
jgi:hypothetical protein